MRKAVISKATALSCRLLLGGVFVFSGFVKSIDPMGFALKTGEYLTAFGAGALRPLALTTAFGLIAFEFTLGVCLLANVYRRCVAALAVAFMCVMTPLTLYVALFRPVADCGCFGDALVISPWATFGKNIVLSVAAVVALFYCRTLSPLFTHRARRWIPACAFVTCLLFALWNYRHLPVIDFRPFKVGVNIAERAAADAKAAPDEYDYAAFFRVYTPDDNDATSLLLDHKGDIFLLIIARTEEASRRQSDRINLLYDYAKTHSIPFYCLTGSSTDAFAQWATATDATYPCLLADDVLLRTVIRSNPGLVWMRNGAILKKWHYNDFPNEAEITKALSDYRRR